MQVVYGLVYYFMVIFITLTLLLTVFLSRSARKLLQQIQTKYQSLFNNYVLNFLINITFVIIGIILVDSIKSFLAVNYQHKQDQNTFSKITFQKTDLIDAKAGQSMLGALKEHREHYLAQRNIVITLGAFYVYYAFKRFFYAIRRLADMEYRKEHPEAISVIPEVVAQMVQKQDEQADEQPIFQVTSRPKRD